MAAAAASERERRWKSNESFNNPSAAAPLFLYISTPNSTYAGGENSLIIIQYIYMMSYGPRWTILDHETLNIKKTLKKHYFLHG